MKNKKNMIFLAAVLVVLIGVYIGVTQYNKTQAAKTEAEAEAEIVTVTDLSDLTKIAYQNKVDDSVDIADMTFEKKDGTWVCTADEAVPLDQSKVNEIGSAFQNITAVRELDGIDDLSDYGLKDPSYTVELTDSAGNTAKLDIGDATEDNNYARLDGKDKVYTIADTVAGTLKFSLNDMIQLDTFPSMGVDTLKEADITIDGKTTSYKKDTDKSALSLIAGGVGALTFTSCENYNASEKDLKQYGLDDASRKTAVYKYTESTAGDAELLTATLYVGNQDDSGTYYYVQPEGSHMVELVAIETVNNAMNISTEKSE